MIALRHIVFGMLFMLVAATSAPAADRLSPVLGDDGLYVQPWFLQSFLDLRDDLSETSKAGRRLAVLFEQRGCPWCEELHKVDFGDPAIAEYVRSNFNVIQINIYGAREVTDFDGTVLTEKALARKWGVRGTPSFVFLPADGDGVGQRSGGEAAEARMPGYQPPETFVAFFRYVRENRTNSEDFQRYLAGLRTSGRATAAE
ncbi:MAG TPA: thioredoxin family protein [Candidatus Cybelea sp.]|nr:thioredoxin family protein [Candidatus Cybelea sp.]